MFAFENILQRPKSCPNMKYFGKVSAGRMSVGKMSLGKRSAHGENSNTQDRNTYLDAFTSNMMLSGAMFSDIPLRIFSRTST